MGDTDLRTQVGQLRIRCVDVVCPGRSRSLWPNPSVVRAATPRLELLLGSSAIWVRMSGIAYPALGAAHRLTRTSRSRAQHRGLATAGR